MDKCLFCGIVEGQVPSKIVYRDQDVIAFADINPQSPAHVLLVPRRHIASLNDLTPEDGPILVSLFAAATKIAQDLGLAERGYRLVTNVGPDAGQAVFHVHFHLMGGRKFGWPPG